MKIKKNLVALALTTFGTAMLSTATYAQSCDEDCLTGIAQQYLQDVVTQDYSKLPWGDAVRYTENNVAMMIGDGYWGAGPGVRDGVFVADASTGNVVWLGVTTEHGQAAYHGIRLKIEDREITEVESYLGREGTPDLFAKTDTYSVGEVFSQSESRSQRRGRLVGLVEDYFDTKEMNDGDVSTKFTDDCARITNGVNVTHGDLWSAQAAQGCEAQMDIGVYKPVDRIRAQRFPVVDVDKGIVVALSIEDHATRYTTYQTTDGQTLNVEVEYPNSRGMIELFKIRDGAIARIEGVSVFLPYYIDDLWDE